MIEFNNEQKLAIFCSHTKNMMLLAGAGSGKTTVIIERVCHLLKNTYASPEQILLITFTTNAAKTLVNRIEKFTGIARHRFSIGTFHSVALKILRRYPYESNLYNRDPNFSILGQREKYSLVEYILNSYSRQFEYQASAKLIYALIDKISSKKRLNIPMEFKLPGNKKDNIFPNIFEDYQTSLKDDNQLDFDDIIIASDRLLEIETIKKEYQAKFKYIFIDEFQDIDEHQYSWISKFINNDTYFLVVGDDDQSIYGFRGSNSSFIKRFQQDIKSIDTVELLQNYRSTRTILAAANAVIKNNTNRFKDSILWTENDKGMKINFTAYNNEYLEAYNVSRQINELIHKGVDISQIVILCRCNYQITAISDHLSRNFISYLIRKENRETELFDSRDKESLSPSLMLFVNYLTFIDNPQSNLALKTIINSPPRGIGPKTIENLEILQHSDSLLENLKFYYKSKKHIKVSMFISWIDSIINTNANMSISQIYNHLVSHSIIDDLEDVKSLIQKFELKSTINKITSENILEFIAFCRTNPVLNKKITISTLHGAKGLEFEYVFIIGLMDEVFFPITGGSLKHNIYEEERRLFYVGLTRAKVDLYLSCSLSSMYASKYTILRFISEIPDHIIKIKK